MDEFHLVKECSVTHLSGKTKTVIQSLTENNLAIISPYKIKPDDLHRFSLCPLFRIRKCFQRFFCKYTIHITILSIIIEAIPIINTDINTALIILITVLAPIRLLYSWSKPKPLVHYGIRSEENTIAMYDLSESNPYVFHYSYFISIFQAPKGSYIDNIEGHMVLLTPDYINIIA